MDDIDKSYIKSLELYMDSVKYDVQLTKHTIQSVTEEIEIHQKQLNILGDVLDHQVSVYQQAADQLIKARETD